MLLRFRQVVRLLTVLATVAAAVAVAVPLHDNAVALAAIDWRAAVVLTVAAIFVAGSR